jgi:beta-sarcoglycan
MRVGPSGVSLRNVDAFVVVDPDTGRVLFDADSPSFHLDDNAIDSLSAAEIETNRIASPVGKDLHVLSEAGLSLVRGADFRRVTLVDPIAYYFLPFQIGTEGISVASKTVTLEAAENILLDAGALLVSGEVILDPLALPLGGGGYPGEKPQYKVCVCLPGGRLFAVASASAPGRTACDAPARPGRLHPCDRDA